MNSHGIIYVDFQFTNCMPHVYSTSKLEVNMLAIECTFEMVFENSIAHP
jgi:hypothetical protein